MTLEKIRCLRCHYEWFPYVSRPRRCPKCGSFHWDEPKPEDEPIIYTPQTKETMEDTQQKPKVKLEDM